jgi:transcription initiation factor TFIID subunit 2
VPLTASISSASFHCFQSEITDCQVNGQGADWLHNDTLKSGTRLPNSTAHQHEQLRKQFGVFSRNINACDLHVRFPEGVRASSQQEDYLSASRAARNDGTGDDQDDTEGKRDLAPITPGLAAFGINGSGKVHYKPITVKLWFRGSAPSIGMRFVDCDAGQAYPHVYTANHPVPCSTSMWLPCLDGWWERSTWELSISVPKSLGDIYKRKNLMDTREDGIEDADETARDQLPITVVSSADLIDETANPDDSSCKIISFAQSSPTGAAHIGFAAGPFVKVNLAEYTDGEEGTISNAGADSWGFCLPDRVAEMRSTCYVMHRAMQFLVRDFGSYPYTSYKICFLQDLETDGIHLASLNLCSSRLLYSERMIDSIYPVTRQLAFFLASQWVGVNTVPRLWSDIWLTMGLAYYMTGLFLRSLMGNNEYRFRLKQAAMEVTEQDIGRPPLSVRDWELPIDQRHLEFIALKAPVVMHLLEQRLTKVGGNLGLMRVLPKIFLQSMSGSLANGQLGTSHFLRQCEKVSHVKLEEFARQWIYGFGFPRFSIVQRFNKKKMVVEMGIRQLQFADDGRQPLQEERFIEQAYKSMTRPPQPPVEAVFTGPMTIRLHEADGTPYEHVVDIKEQFTKLDIPYNNKYRRRVRNRAKKIKTQDGEEEEATTDNINCLGDGLQIEQDMIQYKLQDWTKEDEDKMSSEAFEWLRMDSEFEWICTMAVGQPDYMFQSQLQQDRDVVAQYDAVKYFASAKQSPLVSTILFRTLMDERYYYGIRMLAAQALSKGALPELDMRGEFHLLMAFKARYCFPESTQFVPLDNDFNDFASYFVRCAIVKALCDVRVAGAATPTVRAFMLTQLKHNDNFNNAFDDSFYVATLLRALTDVLLHRDAELAGNPLEQADFASDFQAGISELEKWQRLDRWTPSYQNLITQTVLACKERLMAAKLLTPTLKEFLFFTQEDHYQLVRQQAFQSMLSMGGLRQAPIAKYLFSTLKHDDSAYIRARLGEAIQYGFGCLALLTRVEERDDSGMDALIIEEDASQAVALRKEREMRSTLSGAITALRQELSEDAVLKQQLWSIANSSTSLSPLIRRNMLDVCKVLYEPVASRILKFTLPSMKARLRARYLGNGRMVIAKTRPLQKYQKKAPVKIKLKLFNSSVKRKD